MAARTGKRARRAVDESVVNLATRVPQALYRRVKLYTTEQECLVREFIVGAVQEKLTRDRKSVK